MKTRAMGKKMKMGMIRDMFLTRKEKMLLIMITMAVALLKDF